MNHNLLNISDYLHANMYANIIIYAKQNRIASKNIVNNMLRTKIYTLQEIATLKFQKLQ